MEDELRHLRQLLHDIRGSLAAIQTSVEVALMEPELPPSLRTSLQGIEEEVRKIGSLLNRTS